MNTVDEQGSLYLQRVEEAVADVENARASLEDALSQRDAAIVAALEYGHSVEMLQAATGGSRAWVYAVRDGRRRP